MFLTDPAIVKYLAEAAKTWRKRNGVLIIATQSVQDLAESKKSRALLESLPTKLFLANPAFPPAAAEVFDLSEAEYSTVCNLEPKMEMFLYRKAGDRVVLRLDVDAESYWLYTSSATDAAKRAKVVDRFGLVPGIQRLAAGFDETDSEEDVSQLVT